MKNSEQLIHSFNSTEYSVGHFTGLTKREYFAGLALQGLLANRWTLEHGGSTFKSISKDSVGLADELLKQLEN